jgi:hypothetical protein
MTVDAEEVSIVYLAAYGISPIDCEPAAQVQIINALLNIFTYFNVLEG